jgi:hypothetical protein
MKSDSSAYPSHWVDGFLRLPQMLASRGRTFHGQLSLHTDIQASNSLVMRISCIWLTGQLGAAFVYVAIRPPARAFEPGRIVFRNAIDRSLRLRSDLASSGRSAVRSTPGGADRHGRQVNDGRDQQIYP